ncbi:MAG: DUF2461 domain-containing protein [Oscillospiraceae bacterium]|jgi:uncharacterized protein (TIGR02453 family)|nr:DUF2461 domain-containing protein [Oscillospiraceae bacterium]
MPFSNKTLDFLFENRLQDSKPWFEEHKQQYLDYVLHPLEEMVGQLSGTIRKLDPQAIVDPKVGKTISRIRRDTRFSHDKHIYREHMWLVFKRGPKMYGTDYPGIYFDISPDTFSYGCGFYSASTEYMNALRAAILAGSPDALAAMDALEAQSVFTLNGDRYKRPRHPDCSPQEQKWLDLRGISIDAESSDAELFFSERLGEAVAKDLLLLEPMYQFLLKTAISLHGNS